MDVLNQSSPWNIKVITPSNSLIEKFEKWDKSKFSAHKLRSYHRARKWVSDLLKRSLKIPDTYKLRNVDVLNALQDMVDSMAMPGGLTYDEYLTSCLAPSPKQDPEHEEEFQDAIDETNTESSESKDHIISVHEGKKPFKCDFCDENFSQKCDLDSHIVSVHEGTNQNVGKVRESKKPLKCDICDVIFAEEYDLDSHFASVHEGKKPFKCELCVLSFTTANDLDSHMCSVHEEKMPFKFKVCNENFNKDCDSKIHITRVHEEGKLNTKPTPVCKSIWLGLNCETTNCAKAHPKRCENPNCLILDQGLP